MKPKRRSEKILKNEPPAAGRAGGTSGFRGQDARATMAGKRYNGRQDARATMKAVAVHAACWVVVLLLLVGAFLIAPRIGEKLAERDFSLASAVWADDNDDDDPQDDDDGDDNGDENGDDNGDEDEEELGDPLGEQRELLHDVIGLPEFQAELDALTPLTGAEFISRAAVFQPNLNTAFRLEGEPDNTPLPSGTVPFSETARAIFNQVFSYPTALPGADGLRNHLLNPMSGGQRRRALEALMLTRDFRAQLEMGKEMIEGASGALRDALSLTAAQAAFFASPDDDDAFVALINEAAGSSDADIAAAAQDFLAAVTAPVTFDQLALGHQVFETLFLDLELRESYHAQSLVLAAAAPAIFDSLAAGADADRLDKMARTLLIATEAAFQNYDLALLDWSLARAVDFGLETTEAGIAPRYGRAYFTFVQSDYAAAAAEFDPVFSSLIASNVAADAGVMMAECFLHLDDDVGALAALGLVQANYPPGLYAVQKAARLEAFIRERTDPPGPIVDAAIKQRFGERLYAAKFTPPEDEMAAQESGAAGTTVEVAAIAETEAD
jgi:hypothetical protein